jgi:CBS domain containing-hemolysin-like protein
MTTDLALILLSLFLVLLNGFFVAAEFSIVKLRQTRVSTLAGESGWRGAILARVHGSLDAYLSACQLGITLASLGLGWVGEPAFAELLEPLLSRAGVDDPEIVSGVAFFVAFLTISYLHIVVGELAPKSMAIRMSERVALWTAAPLFVFYWSMYPFIRGLNNSAFWLLRKIGLDATQHTEGEYSIEEIKLILRSSHVDTALTGFDARALAQALDFGEAVVADLMRPFTEAAVLSRDVTLSENLRRIATHRLSRYPYVEDAERVVGIVHLKDVFEARESGRLGDSLDAIARTPLFVPPDLPAGELFRRFRVEGQHLAIVGELDRRPKGFLTFDDLLSALTGGVRDEFRSAAADWSYLEDGSVVTRGSLPMFTLGHILAADVDAGEARTVGGLVLHHLERMPVPGQRVEFELFDVVIEEMIGPRITRLRIFPKPRPEPSPDDDSG